MSKDRPRWLVPITADTSPDVRQYNFTAIITIADDGRVHVGADRPGGPMIVASALEACQLGMALCDAGRVAGQTKARKRGR